MRKTMKWAAALVACVGLHVQAGQETQVRKHVRAEIEQAFFEGDYQAIEQRYAAALATSARTPSGLFVANVIRRAVVPDPPVQLHRAEVEEHWARVDKKLADWAARFPNSSLVAIEQSWAYLGHGWSWRGYGFASSVSPEGFKQVEIYGHRAYEALMARQQVGRKDPYWYVQMFNVARVQGWDRQRYMALVREATQAFPYNYDIYFSIAMRMEPRWGGSTAAIAQLAQYAVEQTEAKEGESMYARIYLDTGDALDADLSGPEVDWKRIRAGFEDLVKRYPDSWNLNQYARMACEARDLPTTRRVLLSMKGDVEQEVWQDRVTFLRCVQAAGLKREDLQ